LCAGLFYDRENLLRNKAVIYILLAFAAPLFFVPASLAAEDFTHFYTLNNGSTVTVYTPEGILSEMTARDDAGNLVFYPKDYGSYYLVEDVDHPAIVNKGSGEFVPVREEIVMEALEAIDVAGRLVDMHIEIYILPMPRLHIMRSTAIGCRIFMSPGVWEISAATTASIITHEFGHCYQNKYLPAEDREGWDEYLGIRGITDDMLFNELGARMYRPSEIFAEDFRALFGGELANVSGTIENSELPYPTEVAGLESFVASLAGAATESTVGPSAIASVGSYPNPFNPSTTIRVEFSAPAGGRDVGVKIYAANGALVRDLGTARMTGDVFEKTWDGKASSGAPAVSGIYFYRVTAGPESHTGKMILVR
jgi:hypothetical protein